ncbi:MULTISPECIES: type II toxin-antitoxin system HigB family toxin [Pseudoalteromonas]|uniref:type II toxin-antitoxin system HigB family toxin n=1 Tax=Pseudoalteromonas TaxID=53246 RepID=UPI00110C020D|nr:MULTISPECIES: type II toxin-antitoxin system HigB family toxin [Pseudoalteromonas]MCG7545459.1 type II toxin-antitoxin system HigB family toxin [Pseudoalteromonas sp. MM17-2]TMO87729.1 cytoplasmic protein [Pseudoalteromonas ruthenica]TMP21534.1 cytoplasmic protein [Pseudoalteromonas ruthenica]
MHVISRKPFKEAALKYPNKADAIDAVYRVLNGTEFKSSAELKKVFASLDNFKYKKDWWVIDIGGNDLRLVAMIVFRNGKVFVKHIVPHAEYDVICKEARKGK